METSYVARKQYSTGPAAGDIVALG